MIGYDRSQPAHFSSVTGREKRVGSERTCPRGQTARRAGYSTVWPSRASCMRDTAWTLHAAPSGIESCSLRLRNHTDTLLMNPEPPKFTRTATAVQCPARTAKCGVVMHPDLLN